MTVQAALKIWLKTNLFDFIISQVIGVLGLC